MRKNELRKDEIGEFYWGYINLLPENAELIECLQANTRLIEDFLKEIPSAKWHYKYGPDKWSLIEVVQHLVDTERIFQYRALSFARGETTPLPGYDHDAYVPRSQSEKRKPEDLIEEFKIVRASGIALFKSFTTDMLSFEGNMNGMPATPRAIGFIMAGHALHHKDIIKNRYL